MIKKIILGLAIASVFSSAYALDVNLTSTKEWVDVTHKNKLIRVQRIQDQEHILTGAFSKTSRKCPPFCIQPVSPAEGVVTVGEFEIFEFMENQLNLGEGVLVDARLSSFYKRGTIPGSVNIPFNIFEKNADDNALISAFNKLGVFRRGKVGFIKETFEGFGLMGANKDKQWDFSGAKTVILWCNGSWCGQSPRAIRGMIKHGYPKEKIKYYRGGMQAWQVLGLTTIVP